MACIVRAGMEGLVGSRRQQESLQEAGFKLRTGAAVKADVVISQDGSSHFFVVAPPGCASAATASSVLSRAKQVASAMHKTCTMLLPAACCAVKEVMDACAQPHTLVRFVFLVTGEDPLEVAIRMVRSGVLNAPSTDDVAAISYHAADHAGSWGAMRHALSAIRFGKRSSDQVSASMAHRLSIFESLVHIAAASPAELVDKACLSPDEAEAMHAFWSTPVTAEEPTLQV